jgi:hypothetical protein
MITGPIIPKTYVTATEIAPDATNNTYSNQLEEGEIITCRRTGRMWIQGRTRTGGYTIRSIAPTGLQEIAYNNSGATILKGSVVYVTGSHAESQITIALADADFESASSKTIGFAAEDIPNNQSGLVLSEGMLTGIRTNTLSGAAGSPIWLSDVAGAFTSDKPVQPKHGVFLGWMIKKAGPGAGSVYVKIINYPELGELHDVLLTTPVDNDSLVWDATAGVWRNEKISYPSVQPVEASSLLGRQPGGVNGTLQEIKLSTQFAWGTAGGKPQLSIVTVSDVTKADVTTLMSTGVGLTGGGDLSANRTFAVDFASDGTVSTTKAVRADDLRLSNARTPTSHVHAISDLSDFLVTSVQNNNVMQYSSTAGKWVNVPQTALVDGGDF